MTARFIVADVFDGLATLEDGSVDLVVTSPPFLALRSYLPANHPDKEKEIGSEATPAEFIDTMLQVTAELRRVLAPHGSICVELGDTYAGSGGGGGDYLPGGWREGQQQFAGSEASMRESNAAHWRQKNPPKTRQMPPNTAHRLHDDGSLKTDSATRLTEPHNVGHETPWTGGPGWPLSKSRTLIPSLYQIALAYGFNPLTGSESPAGQWRIRNVVTWARPNPPVGALGDKWRPATSDLIIACISGKRYWDDLATRKPHQKINNDSRMYTDPVARNDGGEGVERYTGNHESGAPLLDYWVIPHGGYQGAHYAVFPEELVVPCIQAMCPQRVCRVCGEPSRRIVERPTEWRSRHPEFADFLRDRRAARGLTQRDVDQALGFNGMSSHWERAINHDGSQPAYPKPEQWVRLKSLLGIETHQFDDLIDTDREWTESLVEYEHISDHPSGWTQDAGGRVYQRLPARKNRIEPAPEWTDCGHGNYRPGLILDPFAGSGTTLAVATGHGHDAIGIDIDERNADLARDRVGPFLFETVDA